MAPLPPVSAAGLTMIAFGKLLSSWESSGTRPEKIEDAAYELAHLLASCAPGRQSTFR